MRDAPPTSIMVVGEQPGNMKTSTACSLHRTGRSVARQRARPRRARTRGALSGRMRSSITSGRSLGRERIHRTPAQREVEVCQYLARQRTRAACAAGSRSSALGPTALRALDRRARQLCRNTGRTISMAGASSCRPGIRRRLQRETADSKCLRDDTVARIVDCVQCGRRNRRATLPESRRQPLWLTRHRSGVHRAHGLKRNQYDRRESAAERRQTDR